MQIKLMPLKYRGKEVFKPLNTGVIDEHVKCLREYIANIFFYTKNGTTIMIDAGYNYPRLKEKMAWLNLNPADIRHILITHQDTDHVGAVEKDSDLLNGFVLVLFLIAGEADTPCIIGLAVLALLAELIRYLLGYETRKGVRWSFVPLAFSFFAYSAHWWTDTEGSLAAAVEEMRPGYDQMMIPVIENIPALVVALVLTVPVALLGIRLAERALKRQAATFR